MPEIHLRRAEPADLPLLAEMNSDLILAEGSRNPMSLQELEARMNGWLNSVWRVILLEVGESVVGYAIYTLRKDNYFPEQDVVYVRQYYIRAEYRGRSIGRAGFEAMVARLFPKGSRIELEALASNSRGLEFWKSMGFTEYAVTLIRV